jgi:uncharacterized protein with gpF-like domain
MTFDHVFEKDQVNLEKLQDELAAVVAVEGLSYAHPTLTVHFSEEPTEEQVDEVRDIVESHDPVRPSDIVKTIIENAMQFGNTLVVQFATENVLLGITQAGMTGPVRKIMAESIMALQTGSLYDAITELRAIPAESKDPVFITDARLLSAINKIELYLGIPLSESI